MKKSVLLFLVVAMVLSVGGCAKQAATPKIGVCIYKFDDTFMSYVRNEIETAAKGKIELSVQDSQYDQPKQNDQVDQFLADPGPWRRKLGAKVHDLLGRMHELAMILRRRRFERQLGLGALGQRKELRLRGGRGLRRAGTGRQGRARP